MNSSENPSGSGGSGRRRRPNRNRNRNRNRGGGGGNRGSSQGGRRRPPEDRPPQIVEVPTEIDSEKPAPQGAFAELIPAIQCAIQESGYVDPTPVQEQAIRPLLAGKDLLATAQTGTGKTAAFTLPLLQRLHESGEKAQSGRPRALILAPTRELAAQIGDSVKTYGKFLNLRHTVIFGGVGQNPQVRRIQAGVDVLVATPGRLIDLMEQGFIKLDRTEFFVLDEVDRMLDMGFIPDIRKVLAKLPDHRQSLFFSATMVPAVEELSRQITDRPERIAIDPGTPAVERITQHLFYVSKGDKLPLLVQAVENMNYESKVVVFTRMKHQANKVAEYLDRNGIRAAAIHGNKSQGARTKAMDGFRKGTVRCLVATDIAARGIDVDGVTAVVNYDLPMEAETYIHRIGRTARAGAEGDAISFCSEEERGLLEDIERLVRFRIDVVFDHEFHCQHAQNASLSNRPQQGGGGRGRRGGGGGGRGGRRRGGGGGRGGRRGGGGGGRRRR